MKIAKHFALALLVALVAGVSCRRTDNGEIYGKPNQAKIKISFSANNGQTVDNLTGGSGAATNAATSATSTSSAKGGAYLTCTTSGWGSQPDSRASAPGSVDESLVNDIWALQYSPTGTLVGRPVYVDGLGGQSVATIGLTSSGNQSQTVYFVANTGDNALFTAENVPTINTFNALSHRITSEQGSAPGGVLMMTGSYNGLLADGQVIGTTVALERMVSKVVFNYNTTSFEDGTLEVLSVQLKNVPMVSAYISPEVPLAVYPEGTGESHADYAAQSNPNPSAGSYLWYMCENVRGANSSITWQGDKSRDMVPAGQGDYATFVQLRCRATLKDNTSKNILYIFYLGGDITDFSIKRNTAYTFTINLVGVDELDKRVSIDVSTPILADGTTIVTGSITGTSAVAKAVIASDGGNPITDKGFYISQVDGFDPDGLDSRPIPSLVGRPLGAGYLRPSAAMVRSMSPAALSSLGLGAGCGAGCGAGSGAGSGSAGGSALGEESQAQRAGIGTSFFTSLFSGLAYRTTYYIRPYAENAYGRTVGGQISFTTTGTPTVDQVVISLLTGASAGASFQVLDQGASPTTAGGVVYSTIEDFDPTLVSPDIVRLELPFPITMPLAVKPLKAKTTYYIRAFATNSEGTGYGQQTTFTTLEPPILEQVQIGVLLPNANSNLNFGNVMMWGDFVKSETDGTLITNSTACGMRWNSFDFDDPELGKLGAASTRNANRFSNNLQDVYQGNRGPYPGDDWCFYPYVTLDDGTTHYYEKVNATKTPVIPDKTFKVYIHHANNRNHFLLYSKVSVTGAKAYSLRDDLSVVFHGMYLYYQYEANARMMANKLDTELAGIKPLDDLIDVDVTYIDTDVNPSYAQRGTYVISYARNNYNKLQYPALSPRQNGVTVTRQWDLQYETARHPLLKGTQCVEGKHLRLSCDAIVDPGKAAGTTITEAGYVWGTSADEYDTPNKVATDPTGQLSNIILPPTTTTLRTYAINSLGHTTFCPSIRLLCLKTAKPTVASVATATAKISVASAESKPVNGSGLNSPYPDYDFTLAHGLVYSLTPDFDPATDVVRKVIVRSNGNSGGAYSGNITPLSGDFSTPHYVRSFSSRTDGPEYYSEATLVQL